jgi:uncharacterized protein with HEPN domain
MASISKHLQPTLQQKNFTLIVNTHLAVIRCLEVMGEAAKQIPKEHRHPSPEIPWRQLAGTRDRLIHNYSGVDLFLVWNIVRNEFPRLLHNIQTLRSEYL